MKKLMLGGVAIAALAIPAAANAADLPAKAPPYAPAYVAPTWSWAGCYIGGNVGGAWGRSNVTTAFINTVTGVPITNVNIAAVNALDSPGLSPNGFTGGGQIGCNYQTGNIVFGVEADFDFFGLSASQTATGVFPSGGGTFIVNNSVKTDWLFTARPRIGYAWDTFLLYVTGGLAVTNVKFSTSYSDFLGGNEAASFNTTKTGWTVGGGLEYALQRNWSAKIEYLYADFGSNSVSGPFFTPAPSAFSINHNVSLTTHIVRAGLNYKFDWGGPVVARY